MKNELPVSANARSVVTQLQKAGYETYIVGGAIRDMLLGRTPKDFDISTAATPEEIRQVFGRRSARIIGKRFRLAHVYSGRELFEVATFRKAPGKKCCNIVQSEQSPFQIEKIALPDESFKLVRDVWLACSDRTAAIEEALMRSVELLDKRAKKSLPLYITEAPHKTQICLKTGAKFINGRRHL